MNTPSSERSLTFKAPWISISNITSFPELRISSTFDFGVP